MSTYRYARDSRTSAQKAAAQWAREVEELTQSLLAYGRQQEMGFELTDWQKKDRARKIKRLDTLRKNDPNEASA